LDKLSDQDIQRCLGMGRAEMQSTLLRGAMARERLISSNLRLVVSIAKKWARQSAKGDQSVFGGGWDRPSLEEAIQEGILGLMKAVDRFDPERKFRFSTYATWWITNSIRICFQKASTGCLRVPASFYDIRTKFKTLVKSYYDSQGVVPEFDLLAKEIETSPKRLRQILRLTRTLMSTDMPAIPGNFASAGKAGGESSDGYLLSDTLLDTEPQPDSLVELSLLRQNLENAMATELAPFERDIVRLRLGLDDGVTRTCREVAEEYGDSMSMSDVRYVEKKAFKKLRSPQSLSNYKLLTYLDLADVDQATMTFR
jgi:RNA polymerase sigma factor (sigma-70 family)